MERPEPRHMASDIHLATNVLSVHRVLEQIYSKKCVASERDRERERVKSNQIKQ